MLSLVPPIVLIMAAAREEVAVLVEGAGHDAVGSIEGFLDPVAMVDVDVDV